MEYTESASIRSDGQVTEIIRTDAMGGGSVNVEAAYDSAIDELMRSAILCATGDAWQTAKASGSQTFASVAATGDVPAKLTGSYNFASTGAFTAGMWVKLAGFATAANNDIWKVVAVDGTTIYLEGRAMAADGSSSGRSVTQLVDATNGVTVDSWQLEREDADTTTEFHLYGGASVTGMEITVPTTGIITSSYSFEGKVPTSVATTAGTGTDVAAATSSPFAGSDVTNFWEGDPRIGNILTNGTTASEWITEPFHLLDLSLSITPNLRQRKVVGTLGPAATPGRGDINVSGSFRVYYNSHATGTSRADKVLIDKGLNDTVSGLAFAVKDADGNGYIFDLPRVQFTSVNRSTPGKSQDVIADIEFQAYRNPDDTNNDTSHVSGTTIRIARGNW